jgi:uncharacterized protein GlcG (DUF336 family)
MPPDVRKRLGKLSSCQRRSGNLALLLPRGGVAAASDDEVVGVAGVVGVSTQKIVRLRRRRIA